jgi:hypothetical protein
MTRGIALSFERELNCDGIGPRTEQIVTNGIAAAVAPRPGHIDPIHVGLARPPEIGREVFKVVWTILKVRVHSFKERPISWPRLLIFPGSRNNRGRS